MVTIGAAAEEKRHRAGDGVFRRHRGETALDLELAHRTRQVQQAFMLCGRRHFGEQRIDRPDPDCGQHVAAVGIGQRQIAVSDRRAGF